MRLKKILQPWGGQELMTLNSIISDRGMDGTKCGFLCLYPSIRVRLHCGREERLCLKSLFEGSGQEMIGEWQWDSLLPSQSLSVVSECVSESVHPPSVSEVVMSVGSCQSELRMKYKSLLFAPASPASTHQPPTTSALVHPQTTVTSSFKTIYNRDFTISFDIYSFWIKGMMPAKFNIII